MKNKVICLHCKNAYNAQNSKGVNISDFFIFVLMAILLYILFKGLVGFKIVFTLFPLLVIVEYAKRISGRITMECPHCGFDIHLYKRSKILARKRIITKKSRREDKLRELISMGLE